MTVLDGAIYLQDDYDLDPNFARWRSIRVAQIELISHVSKIVNDRLRRPGNIVAVYYYDHNQYGFSAHIKCSDANCNASLAANGHSVQLARERFMLRAVEPAWSNAATIMQSVAPMCPPN